MVEAYPLQWPPGWPRTQYRKTSRFGQFKESRSGSYKQKGEVTMGRARDTLLNELRLLGARDVVISSNVELRLDGLPRSGRRPPDDKGVAIYFTLRGKQQCFPCDKWNRVEDNLYAVAMTINAMRGIERWGSREMVTATFKGFEQLPNNIRSRNFYFKDCITTDQIKARYRELAKSLHPDAGGDQDEWNDMQEQYEGLMAGKED